AGTTGRAAAPSWIRSWTPSGGVPAAATGSAAAPNWIRSRAPARSLPEVGNFYDLRMLHGAGVQSRESRCSNGSIHWASAQDQRKGVEDRREGLGKGVGHESAPQLLIFNMIWQYLLPKGYFR